jgi:hypothetical protein
LIAFEKIKLLRFLFYLAEDRLNIDPASNALSVFPVIGARGQIFWRNMLSCFPLPDPE